MCESARSLCDFAQSAQRILLKNVNFISDFYTKLIYFGRESSEA